MLTELQAIASRLRTLVLVILALVAAGTVAFSLTQDEPLWDAFHRAVDVVATIGSIPAPDNTAGQIVKLVLTIFGVGALFYALVTVAEFFVVGHAGRLIADRRTLRMLAGYKDHHIICGYGRVGRQVARDLRADGAPFVVIDPDPAAVEAARAEGSGAAILGHAAEDEILDQAGIARARALVACTGSDAENVFITLSAREHREDITIVARASQDGVSAKLRRAGADRVVSPYMASGSEMARLALHPHLSGSVDLERGEEYRVDEIEIREGAEGAGRTVADVRGGAIIAALRRDGRFDPQPAGETVLQPGDVIVAIGTPETMKRLEDLFA